MKNWTIQDDSLFICHHLDKSLWSTNQKQLYIYCTTYQPKISLPVSTNWLVLTGTMFKSWYLPNSGYNLKHYNPINTLHHDSSSCTKCLFHHHLVTPWVANQHLGSNKPWPPQKKVASSYFLQMVMMMMMMMVFLQTWFLEIESRLGWSLAFTHIPSPSWVMPLHGYI